MNSAVSPGTMSKRPAFQSALAASMRSWREETKFHQMWRGPSMAAPPTMTKWASLAARIASLEHQQPLRPMAVAADLDLAAEHIDGALFMGGVERQRRAGVEVRVGEQRVPRGH